MKLDLKKYIYLLDMFLIVGGKGSSNRNASRDESVEAGDKSVQARDESIEAREKTPQSCYNDQQALATGYVHWKRTVPYSNVVQKNAQTICTGYKENIVVLESGYFFDYLCHCNWFLLSLLMFILFLYFF